ncbi:type II toxin-antitoxin system HicB family antitoxin [Candidatus Berkelbacteria bacterium]|nr:type II toxin-antitoxin system HicB family antitoxin [Candidatus Berkelbacteria bacterium]
MKTHRRTFRASLTHEGRWVVAQCLEVDVASQGRTEAEALKNLKEALELHFEEPAATKVPEIRDLSAALPA